MSLFEPPPNGTPLLVGENIHPAWAGWFQELQRTLDSLGGPPATPTSGLDNVPDGTTRFAAAEAGADVTANHTAADTTKVNGVASSNISPIAGLMPAEAGADVTSSHQSATTASLSNQTQDALADGQTYARIKVGELTSGQFDFSKGGLNKNLGNIADAAAYKRFGYGTIAARPAFGNAGVVYHAYDQGTNGVTYRDTGTAWQQIGVGHLADILGTQDNIAQGSSRFWVASVDPQNLALINFNSSGHANKNLAYIPDGGSRYAVSNMAGGKAVASVDPNNLALIDLSQSGHSNKTLDYISDGATYARVKSAGLYGGQLTRAGIAISMQTGSNLLFNPLGMESLNGWTPSVGGVFSANSNGYGFSPRIAASGGTAAYLTQPFAPTVVGQYTISGFQEMDSSGGTVGVEIYDVTTATVIASQYNMSGFFSITFTPPNTTDTYEVRLNYSPSSSYFCAWYSLKLEYGSVATPFTDDRATGAVAATHSTNPSVTGLDRILDGPTYGRVKQTALTNNEVDVSLAGVVNKSVDYFDTESLRVAPLVQTPTPVSNALTSGGAFSQWGSAVLPNLPWPADVEYDILANNNGGIVDVAALVSSSPVEGYIFRFDGRSGYARGQLLSIVNSAWSNIGTQENGTASSTANGWYRVRCRWNPTMGKLYIYVNGVLECIATDTTYNGSPHGLYMGYEVSSGCMVAPPNYTRMPTSAASSASATTSLSQSTTTTTINVGAGTVYLGSQTLNLNSGSVNPGAYGTFYVYADCTNWAGGAVTYQATTNQAVATQGAFRVYLGQITTSSSGGGTGGGTLGCFSGDTRVLTTKGFVRFDQLASEFEIVNRSGVFKAKLLVHHNNTEPLRRMGANFVTVGHPFKVGDAWVPAGQIFHEKLEMGPRTVYNMEVQTTIHEDKHYILENGMTAHNVKP